MVDMRLHGIVFSQWIVPTLYLQLLCIAFIAALFFRYGAYQRKKRGLIACFLLSFGLWSLMRFEIFTKSLSQPFILSALDEFVIAKNKQASPYYIIFLWNSACEHCAQQANVLQMILKQNSLQQWQLFCINEGDSYLRAQQDLAGYCDIQGWDQQQRIAQSLQIYTLPLTLLVTAEGQILNAELGYFGKKQWESLYQTAIKRLEKKTFSQ